ncbi:MAG: hypothetical protein WA792_03045 [Pseudolabrys sp.]
MILETIFGLSLVVKASLHTSPSIHSNPDVWPHVSVQQKDAALLPLVQKATQCIIGKVMANPRFTDHMRPDDMNDLIIDSIPGCAALVRAMIDAHDRMYGSGSGEAFLLGPYLDVLPAAVKQVRLKPASR